MRIIYFSGRFAFLKIVLCLFIIQLLVVLLATYSGRSNGFWKIVRFFWRKPHRSKTLCTYDTTWLSETKRLMRTKITDDDMEYLVDKLWCHYKQYNATYDPKLEMQVDADGCSGKIPLIFHQTSLQESIPRDYQDFVQSCIKLNHDMAYVQWTDEDISQFMSDKYPEYLKLLKSYKRALQLSDAFRYFALLYYGGVYLDMDIDCLRPYKDLLLKHSCFFDQERQLQVHIGQNIEFSMANSAMGCQRNHSFIQYVISQLEKHKNADNAMLSTGPIFLTNAYVNYVNQNSGTFPKSPAVTVLPPEVFSPLLTSFKAELSSTCRDYYHKSKSTDFRRRGCEELWASGFYNASWLTNNTVGIHRYTHLGYLSKEEKKNLRLVSIAASEPSIRVLRYKNNAQELERLRNRCYK